MGGSPLAKKRAAATKTKFSGFGPKNLIESGSWDRTKNTLQNF
jgi:hypothetical protein